MQFEIILSQIVSCKIQKWGISNWIHVHLPNLSQHTLILWSQKLIKNNNDPSKTFFLLTDWVNKVDLTINNNLTIWLLYQN